FAVPMVTRVGGALNQEISQDQIIYPCAHRAAVSIVRRADDRSTADVERSVDDHRNSGYMTNPLDQVVVARILLPPHHLQSGAAVDVSNGRQSFSPLLADRIGHQHEVGGGGKRIIADEILPDVIE